MSLRSSSLRPVSNLPSQLTGDETGSGRNDKTAGTFVVLRQGRVIRFKWVEPGKQSSFCEHMVWWRPREMQSYKRALVLVKNQVLIIAMGHACHVPYPINIGLLCLYYLSRQQNFKDTECE